MQKDRLSTDRLYFRFSLCFCVVKVKEREMNFAESGLWSLSTSEARTATQEPQRCFVAVCQHCHSSALKQRNPYFSFFFLVWPRTPSVLEAPPYSHNPGTASGLGLDYAEEMSQFKLCHRTKPSSWASETKTKGNRPRVGFGRAGSETVL